MYSFKFNRSLFAITVVIIVFPLVGTVSFPVFASAQSNEAQKSNEIDYTGFHSNIEQIIGHIEKAHFNKVKDNETNTLCHTLHPIEEVLSLVTIPITTVDTILNKT